MPEQFNDFFSDNESWHDTDTNNDQGASVVPPRPPKSRREMRRRRANKRRKIVRNIIITIVILGFLGGALFFGYTKLKQWRAQQGQTNSVIEDYPGPGDGSVDFTVQSGQGAGEIAENLVKANIVKSAAAFTSAVSANNSTLYPGTYELKLHMAASDVVKILSDQTKATGFLEVRPGDRMSDVITKASQISGVSEEEFTTVVNAGGIGVLPTEANGKFEGWLEPGAYDVKSLKSAQDILKMLVDKRISKLDAMGVPQGAEREKILIIASITEAEVNSEQYYGKVVRVILNRLQQGMNLGMDTTVAYGLGIKASQLTNAMLEDASNPYNTRVNPGLPPGPICNPGDSAISAALDPPQGDWLYFVTTNLQTGETKFATTEDEFWKIRDEYKNNNQNAN